MPPKKRMAPIFDEGNDENESESASKRQKSDRFKIWSWNVAGLRGSIKKGAAEFIDNCGADVVLLQETKCNEMPPEIQRIKTYPFKKLYPSKAKAGHSGVAMLCREKPLKCTLGFGEDRFDDQGRFIHAEFEEFHLINVYVPNSGRGLVNLALRKEWEDLVLEKLTELDKEKPVIYAGDMNVAHEEIDLKNPKSNANKTAGFTDQERNDFTRLLDAGFVDVFRRMNPNKIAYTYWSHMHNARKNNVGWRLDYFVISERLFDSVLECTIHSEVDKGSDHCPISLTLRL